MVIIFLHQAPDKITLFTRLYNYHIIHTITLSLSSESCTIIQYGNVTVVIGLLSNNDEEE